MFEELSAVVIERDLPDYGLRQGDLGAIVHVHADGASYEVEFVGGDGQTVALLTLARRDLRPLAAKEILHARSLAA